MSTEGDQTGQQQTNAGDAAPSGRPSRSGVGMDSVLQHLREHLSDRALDRPGDDAGHSGGPSSSS